MAKRVIDTSNSKVMQSMISTMIAKTPVAYIILDRERKVHFINENFLELRKLNKKDVLGGYCYDVSNRGVPCAQCAVQEAIITGQSRFITRKDVLPDGAVRYIDDYAIPLFKPDGGFDYILEMMINRTPELKMRDESNRLFMNIVDTLISILDKKDAYTSTHSRDVSAISVKLAQYLGMSETDLFQLQLAAMLHDLGKISIPDGIINKTTRLDDNEFALIKKHPLSSYDFLSKLNKFKFIRQVAKYHHEKWNGTGYPEKLKAEDIPLEARIIAIADTYDAMTSTRSYRNALSHDVALEEIHKNAGVQFDPDMAEKFVAMATDWYPSRESLIAPSGALSAAEPMPTKAKPQVERKLVSLGNARAEKDIKVDDHKIEDLMSDEYMAQKIFEHTPAYYVIVDDSFNVLYASDSMTRDLKCTREELLAKRCFEVNDKKMKCFAIENGKIKCPIVRAFQTGTDQTGTVHEFFAGTDMYFDIFAVPLELTDKDGEQFKCAMEILVDRTDEMKTQLAMQEDIKSILDTLYNLVGQIDPTVTKSSLDILNTCQTFGDYLNKMKDNIDKITQD